MSAAVSIPAQPAVTPRFMSGRAAAGLYGVSYATFMRWADRGVVPHGSRLGGRRLWAVTELERHIQGLEGRRPEPAAAEAVTA